MKKFLVAAAAFAALPQLAAAQNLPAPVIGVVNLNRAGTECTACKTAMTALQQQGQQLQQYQTQLEAPLQPEGQAIRTAIQALGNKQPDAALQSRIAAHQTRVQQANQQLNQRAATLQRNEDYVRQQIVQALGPAVQTVQTRRRANLVIDSGSAVRFAPELDITNDVIAELNRTLTRVTTVAPAQPPQQQQQQQPQGR